MAVQQRRYPDRMAPDHEAAQWVPGCNKAMVTDHTGPCEWLPAD